MLEQELLDLSHELVRRAQRGGADHAEGVAGWYRSVETGIENSRVHTVQSAEETIFGVRVFVGESLGFATANGVESASIDDAVADAIAQARATPPDPFNGLPTPLPVGSVPDLFDERLSAVDVATTTALAHEMITRVTDRDTRVRIDSGSVSASTGASALASSTGMYLAESATSAHGYLFGMAVDGQEVASFDYEGDGTRRLFDLEAMILETADRFTDKCLSGLGAAAGRSFHGSVVLSPEAVGELLVPSLIAAISADAVRKGRSPLAGRVGTSIAASGFTLIDDGTIPGGIASSAFDREGVPVRRHVLVSNGTLQTYLYNHYEARAAGNGVASTGHGTGSAGTLPSIGPSHLEIPPGSAPLADLQGNDEPVVYVGRFSGSTNPVTGEFSGVAKNSFLVERGTRRPIRETLIAGNVFRALEAIEGLSVERRRTGGNHLFPAIRIADISVTAG